MWFILNVKGGKVCIRWTRRPGRQHKTKNLRLCTTPSKVINKCFAEGVWSQTAGPGEENPDRGWWDPCSRVWDEETGGFIPGETRGTDKVLRGFKAARENWGKEHGMALKASVHSLPSGSTKQQADKVCDYQLNIVEHSKSQIFSTEAGGDV